MSTDRRTFLGVAGLSALALAGGATLRTASGGGAEPEEKKTGKRWAMVIQPYKCLKDEGCRDCAAACHKVHNVPSFPDRKHEVKWIWKEPYEKAFAAEHEFVSKNLREKPVLVFCNHCDNPPCVRVCPTKATWKREDGVVMMDWHRCIGCRYCVAACPYGSRSFNWLDPRPRIAEITPDYPTRTKGVVEKCTLCEERLSEGKLPACVEACKEKALVFGDLNDERSEVRALLEETYTIRRKPELGTNPEVYYVVGGPNPAMEQGKIRENHVGRPNEKETFFAHQGIGAPSSLRREGTEGGVRLHGLCPWSGEGMAPPRRGEKASRGNRLSLLEGVTVFVAKFWRGKPDVHV